MTDTIQCSALEATSVGKSDNNGSSNAKAFGGVIAIVAIICGVYAMVEPMNQRIEFIQSQIQELDICIHQDNDRVWKDTVELSVMQQKFAEVEMKFKEFSRRMATHEEWQLWWHRTVPSIDARQNEKILRLESEIYGMNNEFKLLPTFKKWVPEITKEIK